MKKRRVKALLSVLGFIACTSVLPPQSVSAGSGFNTWKWGDAGYTISSTSYKYSNMTGFWQSVLNDLGRAGYSCQLTVDGVYGNATTWWTAAFQNDILGYNNGGIMTSAMLNAAHQKKINGVFRLGEAGYVDAYGTVHYFYYAGTGNQTSNNLGWNVFGGQWMFALYPVSNPTQLTHATPSPTIGSTPPCA